jgi:hypothetical protein
MFSSLSILTAADDGSKQRYINNENWSDGKYIFFFKKVKIIVKNWILDFMQNFRLPFWKIHIIPHVIRHTLHGRYDLLHFKFITYAKLNISWVSIWLLILLMEELILIVEEVILLMKELILINNGRINIHNEELILSELFFFIYLFFLCAFLCFRFEW